MHTAKLYSLIALCQPLLHFCGVKGPPCLTCLQYFNPVWGFSVEYMHCVMEGVVKLLLSLWTDTARCRGTLHDIERDLYLVDQRIGQVQFPTEMPQKPRGLKDHLSNWKGALCV